MVQRTVLVVDDDVNVLEVLQALLQAHGSDRVLSASGFHAAMDLLEGGRVDILLVDAVLPKPHSGRELAHAARKIRRDTAVVLISGDGWQDMEALPQGTVFLPKPFGSRQVHEAFEIALANVAP
jgi:FixJ family two-component response regulator